MEKKKPYEKAELEIYDFGEEQVYADTSDSDNFAYGGGTKDDLINGITNDSTFTPGG